MTIVELLTKARATIIRPKLIYPCADAELVISYATKADDPNFHNIGYINFKHGQNKYYLGAVTRTNEYRMVGQPIGVRNNEWEAIQELMVKIQADPAGAAKVIGKEFGYCCFCGTYITSKNSLAVGYGPICAENWGLPW